MLFFIYNNNIIYASNNNRDVEILNLVPLRDLLDNIELNSIWSNETKSLDFVVKDKKVQFQIKANTNIANKEAFELLIINDKGYAKLEDLDKIGISYKHLDYNLISIVDKVNIGDKIPLIESDVLSNEDLNIVNNSSKDRILFFWATWCPYCDEYIEEIKKIYKSNSNDFEIVAINIDDELNKEKVKEKIDKSLDGVINILDLNKEIINKYSPEGVPATYFINSKNVIVDSWFGVINEKEILEKIQK